MLKKILIILIIIISIFFCLSLVKIEKQEKRITISKKILNDIIPIKIIKEKPIGLLEIPSINLYQDLYSINSIENNIEKHVTIIEGTNYPNKIILAAHSGEGDIALFNDLSYLKEGNTINLTYYEEKRIYAVESIKKVNKKGYIRIPKKNHNYLILTTCDKENLEKQIIVYCIEKES